MKSRARVLFAAVALCSTQTAWLGPNRRWWRLSSRFIRLSPVSWMVSANPSLIVAGVGSPHAFSLKPSQAAALEDADLIFWVGPEMETFLAKPIETIGAHAKRRSS